jgi:hypothetical protein
MFESNFIKYHPDDSYFKGGVIMKKSKVKIQWWLLIIICCLPFFACLFPTQPSNNIVRTAVKLSQSEFPDLTGATEVRAGERPWVWEIGDEPGKCYVIKFNYQWKFSADDILDIDVIVAESREQATNYLTYRRQTSCIAEFLQPPEDKPPVAGNISYGEGQDFIRDNIIVEIRAYGTLKEKTTAIAKQVDALLRTSRTASSTDRFKPKIQKFQIAQNPVRWQSTTPLIIEVKDPLGSRVFYDWRFSSNYGGIVIDESGNYHYYYAESETGFEKLILIAINEGGFFATAEIDIEIKGVNKSGL